MPIQTSDDGFVHFRYAPDHLTAEHRRLRADGVIGPTPPFVKNCVRSEIVLDGGNAVRWRDAVILTDKVFRENADLSRQAVVDALKADLALPDLIVVPRKPCDPIAHSDGMICWLHENLVLVNDYSAVGEPFRRILRRSRLDVLELPYEPQPGGRGGIPTAAGNWMNFLRIRDLLIVPAFGLNGDDRALAILGDLHPGDAIEALACRDLAEGV